MLPGGFCARKCGDSFPEKFDSVSIANNVLHLSAGPTEALFEIDNFLGAPLGLDIFKEEAKLASELVKKGLSQAMIKKILTDKTIHAELEHRDTDYAINFLKRLSSS